MEPEMVPDRFRLERSSPMTTEEEEEDDDDDDDDDDEALHMTPLQEHASGDDVTRQSRRLWSGSLSEDLSESKASISGA